MTTGTMRPGDIVALRSPLPGQERLRYLVREIRGDWIDVCVARRDGRPDRRCIGWSGSAHRFELARHTPLPRR